MSWASAPFFFFLFCPIFSLFLFIGFSLKLMFSFSNMVFCLTVLLISVSVLKWSSYYMEKTKNFSDFILVTTSFVFSMMIFIFSEDVISLLMGYDLLGITSFLLIMYYKNQKVINSAMVTIMMNKVGDFFLIWAALNFFLSFSFLNPMSALLFLLALSVKSAQLPFSAWLPIAMAAPTPISALVHSSTLVTAGVYLVMKIYFLNNFMFLFLIASFTLVISSLQAILEKDMKKVVALSTMSQMSFISLALSTNLFSLAFLHLIVHAFFKSMMFISMGFLIHQSIQNQLLLSLSSSTSFSYVLLQTSVLSLMGLSFTSGFYSKDLLLEFFEGGTFILFNLLLLLAIFFTFLYSSRLLFFFSGTFFSPETPSPPILLFFLSLSVSGLFFLLEKPESSKTISLIYQTALIFILFYSILKAIYFNKMLALSYLIFSYVAPATDVILTKSINQTLLFTTRLSLKEIFQSSVFFTLSVFFLSSFLF